MSKIILHYVDWNNTKGNHAGMAHLCRYLASHNSSIKLKKFPIFYIRGGKYINFIRAVFHTLYFLFFCKNGDTIFFMEYLTRGYAYQEITARIISYLRPGIRLSGMVHLSGNVLLKNYKTKHRLKNHLNALSQIWVLGTSLETFMINLGIDKSKIICTFHYVDTGFYKPYLSREQNNFEVLIQGNQLRDYNVLKQIILECPQINFTIMQGVKDLSSSFGPLKNVNLIGFVPEEKLLSIMQKSNVALCVMEDTVGSNVITTSMACSLAMVVSDIGSIRDYCDINNSIFCNNVQDYIDSLNLLHSNINLCRKLQQSSMEKSLHFSIDKFKTQFYNKLITNVD